MAQPRASEGSLEAGARLRATLSLDGRPIEREVAKDSAQAVASRAGDAPSCLRERPLRKARFARIDSSARVRVELRSTHSRNAMAHRSQLTAYALLGAAIIALVAMIAMIAQVSADEAPQGLGKSETLSTSRQAHGHAEEHVTLGQRKPRSSARARATGESASVAVTVSVEVPGLAPPRAQAAAQDSRPASKYLAALALRGGPSMGVLPLMSFSTPTVTCHA